MEHTALADDVEVEVVVSELVTNALRHGSGEGDEIELLLELNEAGATVRVSDRGLHVWSGEIGGAGDVEAGRGLEIVNALAAKVGHNVRDGSQTVWALLTWEAAV